MDQGIQRLLDRLSEMEHSQKKHIVEGAEIWWGQFQDIHEIQDLCSDRFSDPENQLIAKDGFQKLSGPAKTAYTIIENLDEAFFKKNGRLKKLDVERHLKSKLRCSIRRVREILEELARYAIH